MPNKDDVVVDLRKGGEHSIEPGKPIDIDVKPNIQPVPTTPKASPTNTSSQAVGSSSGSDASKSPLEQSQESPDQEDQPETDEPTEEEQNDQQQGEEEEERDNDQDQDRDEDKEEDEEGEEEKEDGEEEKEEEEDGEQQEEESQEEGSEEEPQSEEPAEGEGEQSSQPETEEPRVQEPEGGAQEGATPEGTAPEAGTPEAGAGDVGATTGEGATAGTEAGAGAEAAGTGTAGAGAEAAGAGAAGTAEAAGGTAAAAGAGAAETAAAGGTAAAAGAGAAAGAAGAAAASGAGAAAAAGGTAAAGAGIAAGGWIVIVVVLAIILVVIIIIAISSIFSRSGSNTENPQNKINIGIIESSFANGRVGFVSDSDLDQIKKGNISAPSLQAMASLIEKHDFIKYNYSLDEKVSSSNSSAPLRSNAPYEFDIAVIDKIKCIDPKNGDAKAGEFDINFAANFNWIEYLASGNGLLCAVGYYPKIENKKTDPYLEKYGPGEFLIDEINTMGSKAVRAKMVQAAKQIIDKKNEYRIDASDKASVVPTTIVLQIPANDPAYLDIKNMVTESNLSGGAKVYLDSDKAMPYALHVEFFNEPTEEQMDKYTDQDLENYVNKKADEVL